jgi:hypothetical protein
MKSYLVLALALSLSSISLAMGEAATELPWKTNTPIATVKKQLYLPHAKRATCTYVRVGYIGSGLERAEHYLLHVEETSAAARAKGIEGRFTENKVRRSTDNGRTWSAFTSLPLPQTEYKNAVITWRPEAALFYDPVTKRNVSMWLRQTQDGTCWFYSQIFARTSTDGGQTWNPGSMLRYEDGDDFDPKDPLKKSFLIHNQAFFGSNIIRHSNGTLIHCVAHANSPGTTQPIASLCFIGTWDSKAEDYRWTPGTRVSAEKRHASREFDEPNVAELRDGRVLVVWRRGGTPNESIRKWYSVSTDGGRTLSPPAEWKYDDGSRFYSPSSFHLTLRHSITGKLYWVGNIVAGPHPSGECQPRFPLIIAEIE